MDFKAKIDYNKEYLSCFFNHELKYLFLALKVLSLTPLAYLIYQAVRQRLVPGIGYGIKIYAMLALAIVLITVLIWVCFNMANIAANSALQNLIRQKRDGEHSLIFNEQGLIVRSLKYSTEQFYPSTSFKSVTMVSQAFRLCIGTKRMYIKPEDFEVGAPEDFYKWAAVSLP